jgi:hypothetical protein
MHRKKWSKPQLIVLVRGKQEAVLWVCKAYETTPGPNNAVMFCTLMSAHTGCWGCEDYLVAS